MPLYIFYNSETDEEFEDILSISDKEKFLADNPHIIQRPTSFGIVSAVGGIDSKTDDTWKEVLSKVAENNKGSKLDDRYGMSKSMKEIKTREAVEKYKQKIKNL